MLVGYVFWLGLMLVVAAIVVAALATLPLVAAMWPITLTAIAVVVIIGWRKARKHGRREEPDQGPDPF